MSEYDDILQRVEKLEAVDAIKRLKSNYLYACDSKQPELMRNCFVDGPVNIDYGPVGKFTHRDQLVDIFVEVGCHDHMLEMHHAHNPVITLEGSDNARATWELMYQLINTKEKIVTQLALVYHDVYTRVAGEWKISETVTENISTMVTDIGAESIRAVHVG